MLVPTCLGPIPYTGRGIRFSTGNAVTVTSDCLGSFWSLGAEISRKQADNSKQVFDNYELSKVGAAFLKLLVGVGR